MNIKNLFKRIYDENIDIRQRLFVFNILSIIVILGITSLEILFTSSMFEIAIATFGFLLVIIIISIVSVWKNRIRVGSIAVTALMCFIYFPITFVNTGGIKGTGSVWFIFNILLIALLLERMDRVVMFILEDLVFVGCYIVAFLFPDIFPTYVSGLSIIYSFTAVFLISIEVSVMLVFENRLYIKMNEKAKKQTEEIEALNASQNRFFSSMSHEIRTPINTIIGLNEMILREDISDEVAEDAVNIRVAGKLLLNLINDILDMSKFQAGDMKLLLEPYHPGNMLSDIVGMLWIRAKEKNLDFNVNVSPDLPVELIGDEVRIKQVLMNVLNNSIKYTKEGSITLSVECEEKEDGIYNVIYSVTDTGMGIKKEDIPYLFTAFKRVDESNTKHIEGTGLGLSIVKQFVDLMGGKVTVNSVYTKGTTFIIEIPEKATTDKQIGEYDYKKTHGIKTRSSYKQKFEAPEVKILVVDDNEANLLVVTKLLRDTRVQIDTAHSGAEALSKTLDTKYHMIFMDHLMPEMDGIECFKAIKVQVGGQNHETDVIILTANAGEENRALYAETGFDGYLVKPVSGEELESEVIRHVPKELIRIVGEAGEISSDSISWMKQNQKKRRVAVVTESIADLPADVLKKYGIAVIPHSVKTTEGTFKDGIEISTEGVLKYMENSESTVLPIAPSVSEMESFFANQLTMANNLIYISISGDIENSGYPNAALAANSFDNVTVVDSGHLSSGEGLMAVIAARMAEAGMGREEIVARLEKFRKKIHTSFIVDNLDYLSRSGQVSARRAGLIRAFQARTMIRVKDGKIGVARVYFGDRRKTWKKYIDKALSVSGIDKRVVFVTYVGLSIKELEWIKDQIMKKKNFDKIIFQMANPSIAANCGPGTFGILLTESV